MAKIMGNNPQNEIDPGKLFAGYTALAPMQGGQPVMQALQNQYDFEAAKPERISDLVRPDSPHSMKLGQP